MSIVSCKDMDAEFKDAGEHVRVSVGNLAITASGDVVPLMVVAGNYEVDFVNFIGLHERWEPRSYMS